MNNDESTDTDAAPLESLPLADRLLMRGAVQMAEGIASLATGEWRVAAWLHFAASSAWFSAAYAARIVAEMAGDEG